MSKRPETPAFIIVGVPGLKEGIYRGTCVGCKNKFPMQASTAMTVAQLGKQAPPIVCYTCAVATGILTGPSAEHAVGIREARARYGLDN